MDNKKFNELIEEFCVIPLRNIILEVEEWNDLTEKQELKINLIIDTIKEFERRIRR